MTEVLVRTVVFLVEVAELLDDVAFVVILDCVVLCFVLVDKNVVVGTSLGVVVVVTVSF